MKKVLIILYILAACLTSCLAGELQKTTEKQLYKQFKTEIQNNNLKNLLQEDYYGYQHGKNSMYGYAINILEYDYKNKTEKQIAYKIKANIEGYVLSNNKPQYIEIEDKKFKTIQKDLVTTLTLYNLIIKADQQKEF